MSLLDKVASAAGALGIGSKVAESIGPDFKPLHSVCEYLNALHVYADEARRGEVRTVEAHHFCAHVNENLRQCLIYDSLQPQAKLIGVEFMVPKHVYEKLAPEEQKLWHSHEYEVSSGMLIIPMLTGKQEEFDAWETAELQAMKEVSGLYGKTWHFWETDKGHEIPLGYPKLMGSLTKPGQVNLDEVLRDRNERYKVDHNDKATKRKDIKGPGVHPNADFWWQESSSR